MTTLPILSDQLAPLVPEIGIEKTEANNILSLYAPSLVQLSEAITLADGINKEQPTDQDATIARKARLAIVKIRTAAAEVKKNGKAEILIRGGLHDSAFNVVKHSCELAELELEAVEKHRENEVKQQQEAVKAQRIEAITEFGTDVSWMPLATMTEDQWNEFYEKEKTAFAARKEAEEKEKIRIEQERIEAEKKAEAERVERERIAAEERTRLEAIEKENAKLRAEAEAKEKQRQKEIEEENKKRAKEQEEQRQRLQKEQEEKAKLQAELERKQAEEQRAKAEAEAKEAEAEKARVQAQKAPDKQKIKTWVNDTSMGLFPDLSSEPATELMKGIHSKFEAFKKWAQAEVDKL